MSDTVNIDVGALAKLIGRTPTGREIDATVDLGFDLMLRERGVGRLRRWWIRRWWVRRAVGIALLRHAIKRANT